MKRWMLSILILSISLPGALFAMENPWEIKLLFEKATITYSLGGMQNGTQILAVRNHGKETASYTKAETIVLGMSVSTEEMEIVTPDWIYSYNLTERTGVKSTNPQKYMIEEYSKLSEDDKKQVALNAENMGFSMTEGFGGKLEKNATAILGYPVDKMSIMGTTVYTMHQSHIPLKTEINMMGMQMSIEATEVKEGVADAIYFEHPQDIEPVLDQQSDKAAQVVASQTISMLKNPDSMEQNLGPMLIPQLQNLSPEEQKEMEQAMEALKKMFGN